MIRNQIEFEARRCNGFYLIADKCVSPTNRWTPQTWAWNSPLRVSLTSSSVDSPSGLGNKRTIWRPIWAWGDLWGLCRCLLDWCKGADLCSVHNALYTVQGSKHTLYRSALQMRMNCAAIVHMSICRDQVRALLSIISVLHSNTV